MIGSDEFIKLRYTDVKLIGSIFENVDGITLGLDVGTDIGSIDRPFDISNDGKLEGLFIGDSLVFTGGKVLGSDKGIKMGSTDAEVLGVILVNVYGITLVLDVGTDLGSFY